ncbi:MAG: hypothetical protein CMK08_13490 [Ponticaulis sp.]|nr:hypothetical protein [Ponticaulis sp.]MBN05178.1 hypothetical protein [Ponticaulis sp.]|tara:strand:- start:152 stop:376 length:225 start_codon:yes stop_codon:yes gene_type:complete
MVLSSKLVVASRWIALRAVFLSLYRLHQSFSSFASRLTAAPAGGQSPTAGLPLYGFEHLTKNTASEFSFKRRAE